MNREYLLDPKKWATTFPEPSQPWMPPQRATPGLHNLETSMHMKKQKFFIEVCLKERITFPRQICIIPLVPKDFSETAHDPLPKNFLSFHHRRQLKQLNPCLSQHQISGKLPKLYPCLSQHQNTKLSLGRRVGGRESTKCTEQVCSVRNPLKIWPQISFLSPIKRIWDEMNPLSLSSETYTSLL